MLRTFSTDQRHLLLTVAFLETLRTFGIFMANPIVALYADHLGASNILAGIALGAYGLTMAVFQFPMGRLSDSIGRKRAIFIAAIPFIAGNLLCFNPINIYGLIAGRLVAGAGTINAASIAMVQENVANEQRSRAMAILGIPVGLGFLLGTAFGPEVFLLIGGKYIFLMIAALTAIGIIPVFRLETIRPASKFPQNHKGIGSRIIGLSLVGFLASAFVMMFFYFVPLRIAAAGSDFLLFFIIPVIVGGGIAVMLASVADRGHTVLLGLLSLIFLAASAPLIFSYTLPINVSLFSGTTVFILGFSIYEIVFTPIASRMASAGNYGSSIGLLRSLQYLGQFTGSAVAGLLYISSLSQSSLNFMIVALLLAALSAVLLYAVTGLREPSMAIGKT
ncbi:MAG TPA: MFS transporter [Thermoplasmataceae archaeon]|nr:MFS transporter [Thermoplasmatales archaeon AK]HLH85874.1 MFS transporter [Thermoplasmataceae archaeon]